MAEVAEVNLGEMAVLESIDAGGGEALVKKVDLAEEIASFEATEKEGAGGGLAFHVDDAVANDVKAVDDFALDEDALVGLVFAALYDGFQGLDVGFSQVIEQGERLQCHGL